MICYTTMKESIKMELFQKLFGKKLVNIATKEKTVNVLVMGKAAVGKTSLIRKLIGHETFSEEHVPTLYDDMIKEVNVEEYKVTFKFMELGGTQAFPTMQEVFIQQAEIYILVYSVDDVESYNALLTLREKVVSVKKKCYSELPIIVVRNKVDIRRRRSKIDKTHKKSVANWCYLNHDVSSKTGLRVNSIMDNLIEESKFIGNERDENNFHISGRYIYSEKNEGESELYHKAPGIFNSPDNSDEKMNARRMKLQNRLNRRNLSSSMPSLKRSLSLTSLRRSMRRFRGKRKSLPNRDYTLSEEMLSGSHMGLKQSTRSLNNMRIPTFHSSRSSTLPEKQVGRPCDINVRSSTLPEKISRESYISVSDVSNADTPDIASQDKRKSFQGNMNSVDRSAVVRREKSKSLYLPRTCNSLLVPSKDTNIPLSVSEQLDKSTTSINKSVSFRGKEKARPKLSRQFSTDQGSMRDISGSMKFPMNDIQRQPNDSKGNVRDTHTMVQRTNNIHGSTQMVSPENTPESIQHSNNDLRGCVRNTSPKNRKEVTLISNDLQGSMRRNSPENIKEVLQYSNDKRRSICKNSPESIKDMNDSSSDISNKLSNVNNNIRASNSPQVLRSIPVMRRLSLSQNDLTDMFTVNIPEPKRKPSGIFKVCKTSRRSSPTNNSPKTESNKSVERKHSDSSSDKSYVKESQPQMKSINGTKCYNEGSKEKPMKELSSFDNKTNIHQNTRTPLKLPLSRVRSKSSSEVHNSPASDKKSGSIGSNSSYSGIPSKRASWTPRGLNDSKPKLKSILKNSGEGTPTNLKVPLRKVDSLSHDDIRKVSTPYQEKFNKYQCNSNRSSENLSKRSSMRVKPINPKREGSPIVQAKRWLQSVAFNKAIDE